MYQQIFVSEHVYICTISFGDYPLSLETSGHHTLHTHAVKKKKKRKENYLLKKTFTRQLQTRRWRESSVGRGECEARPRQT